MYYVYSDELYHYGVKGMKWGVRRYQNYDGSYTQAGVKRFHDSLNNYEKTKARTKSVLKDKNATRSKKDNAKIYMRNSKRQLKKDYKHLKNDKLADKGRHMYAQGHRIRNTRKAFKGVSSLASVATLGAAYARDRGIISDSSAKKIFGGAIATAGAAYVASAATEHFMNRPISEYYAHTSNRSRY